VWPTSCIIYDLHLVYGDFDQLVLSCKFSFCSGGDCVQKKSHILELRWRLIERENNKAVKQYLSGNQSKSNSIKIENRVNFRYVI
jgi:hypothetical protein